jgi:hypothetical protein
MKDGWGCKLSGPLPRWGAAVLRPYIDLRCALAVGFQPLGEGF